MMAIVQKNPLGNINDWPNKVMKLLPTNLVLKNFEESRELFFREQERIRLDKRHSIERYLLRKEPLKKLAFNRGQKSSLRRFLVNILAEGIRWKSSLREEASSLVKIAHTLANKLSSSPIKDYRQDEEYFELYEALDEYFNVAVFLPYGVSPNLDQKQQSLFDFLLNKEFLNLMRHDNGPCLRVSLNDRQEIFDVPDQEIDRIFQRTLNNVAVFF